MSGTGVRLLVVGDVHGAWDQVDASFVESRAPDAAVFVGDLGDQDMAIVERVCALSVPTFVVLGNHDAWFASRGGELEPLRAMERRLGERDLAYRAAPLGDTGIALLGARPYSWGGPWRDHRRFYREHLGLGSESDSADRILAAAETVPDHALVVVGHNGPTGLGEARDAIYGRDFRLPEKDWGDADLRLALDTLREEGRRVPLVVAGHMHHRLRGGGARVRRVQQRATTHLNTAVVPRHRRESVARRADGLLRHFLSVEVTAVGVETARDLWVDDGGHVVEATELVAKSGPSGGPGDGSAPGVPGGGSTEDASV